MVSLTARVAVLFLACGFLSEANCTSSLPLQTDESSGMKGDLKVYISEAGHDTPGCTSGGVDKPCQSLAYVADYTSENGSMFNSLMAVIQGPTLQIGRSVYLVNVTNLMVIGSPTHLQCTCQHCGVTVTDSQNVTIQFLNFSGCGTKATFGSMPLAAVIFYECHDITVENCSFVENNQSGLYIRDTFGEIDIRHSIFEGNGMCSNCTGSSGLTLRFISSPNNSCDDAGTASNYTIEHCSMFGNRDSGAVKYEPGSLGGGVDLQFKGNSCGNSVTFRNVRIEENSATWGGGMGVEMSQNAERNRVFLNLVTFRNNSASKAGGGLDVGYINGASDPPISNVVFVENCRFVDNRGRYGAGTAVYASHTDCVMEDDHDDNTLVFKSCRWSGNVGSFGSTIDISPFSYDTLGSMYFPHPKFIDCWFTANHSEQFETTQRWTFLLNVGSFTINAFEALFEETVHFENHTVTPLHVTDGRVTFLPGAQVYFKNNHGSQGGALALIGSSILQVLPNTTLSFINNTASSAGGAIYQSTQNHHDFFSSRTCFISNGSRRYHSESGEQPVLYFWGNSVSQKRTGHAIYATTFFPCYFQEFISRSFNSSKVMKALRKIVNLDFGKKGEKTALATSGWSFQFSNKTFSVIPGRAINISPRMKDELNNNAPSVYRVLENKMCPADRRYMIDRITVSSKEQDVCSLSLISLGFRESLFKVNVTILKCPPGFYMDAKTSTCSCSVYNKNKSYYGINTCHDRESNAYLSNSFWAGYDEDGSLLTAHCPSSFCVNTIDREVHGIKLPNSSSPDELVMVVCHPHRKGWLCGRCEPNHTTYFHSPTYLCRKEHLCAWGVLFYLVSEILPILILFSVIALFDIRFTTGTASGLVFFAQIIDTMTLEMKWNTRVPQTLKIFSNVYRVVYGLLNFDFFNLESASFCLWRNATVLDVVTFRYISVLFAFVLLSSIVLFLKYCTCSCLPKHKGLLMSGRNRSVVHSMSAVLVMCYAQCTNISFQILAKATLRGPGSKPLHTVTLYGGVHYLSVDHLAYAVAACLCLSTVVAIPPFLLLVYPTYLTVFSFCKLNETWLAQSLSRFFIKLKPFFDSFQGCYQDKLRFFSAFYFLGRVAILAINAFVTSTSQSILTMIMIIVILLGMHALCQPFRHSRDNNNSVLILVNLSLISLFTALAYSQDGYEEQRQVVMFSLAVRLILLYLPILCTVAWVAKKIICLRRRRKTSESNPNEMAGNVANVNSQVIDHTYLPYQEVTIDTSQTSADAEVSYSYTDREELLAYI